jgi:hypothetical protein
MFFSDVLSAARPVLIISKSMGLYDDFTESANE